jgi:Ca2+/Na+ antiporter
MDSGINVTHLAVVWHAGLQPSIQATSALAFNTGRYLVAAVVIGAICLVTRARFTKQAVLRGSLVGLAYAFTVGFEGQALAQGRVTFLGSLFVALMPFLGYLFRSTRLCGRNDRCHHHGSRCVAVIVYG